MLFLQSYGCASDTYLPFKASACLVTMPRGPFVPFFFSFHKDGEANMGWQGLDKEQYIELFWDLKMWKRRKEVLGDRTGLCGWLHNFEEVEALAGHEIASLLPTPSPQSSETASVGQQKRGRHPFLEANSADLGLYDVQRCRQWSEVPQETLQHPGANLLIALSMALLLPNHSLLHPYILCQFKPHQFLLASSL